MSIKLALELLRLQRGCWKRESVSLPQSVEAVAAFLKEHGIAKAAAVIWQINKIFWCKWEQGGFRLPEGGSMRPELWQELRIFNEAMELKLTCDEGTLHGRLLEENDGAGEPCEYVDSLSRLWGEAAERQGDWLLLEDKSRKLRQEIPAPEEEARFYGLVTRNYIGINERTAQAGYEDYRYVKICAADVEG